jgi:O6-methylguanine-DNA--protein-cysteine methyltransferase
MMTTSNDKSSSMDDKSDCIKCEDYRRRIQELEQALTGKEDEISYTYRLNEDKIFVIKTLKEALSYPHGNTNN